jgi:hypothetical protein
MNVAVNNWYRTIPALVAALALAACVTAPPPRTPPSEPVPTEPEPTTPTPPPEQPSEPPPPAPVVPEPVLGAASRALVDQARGHLQAKNYPLAASTLERALRIEPSNALLWIELGKVRQAEGNYVQAENMGRRAASLTRAPKASAAAWRLIADALRARGRTSEAQQAASRADSFR